MAWFGKIFGGLIGLLFGGPLGAILGASLGHVFADKGNNNKNKSGQRAFYRNFGGNRSEMIFFTGVFSLTGKVAAVDGRISAEEIQVINGFIDQHFRLDMLRKQYALAIVRQAASSQESAEDIAMQLRGELKNKPQVRELLIDILIRIAAADGQYTHHEERLIKNITVIFELSDSFYNTVKNRYVNADGSAKSYQQYRSYSSSGNGASANSGMSLSQAYSILGCSPASSNDDIKKSYRKLVKKYHPDALNAAGVSEDFRKIASEKFSEISNAYECVKKNRNF